MNSFYFSHLLNHMNYLYIFLYKACTYVYKKMIIKSDNQKWTNDWNKRRKITNFIYLMHAWLSQVLNYGFMRGDLCMHG